jgi:hypothetical protein
LHILERPDSELGSTFVQMVEENMSMFTER